MALPQTDRQDRNRQQVEQLTYVLRNRHKPTVVLITYDTPQKRGEIHQQLRESLAGSQFNPLNLESVSVTSLVETFKQKLSRDFLEKADPSCIVNVFGLENSLIELKDGRLQQSSLISSMNFERELFFREMPFTTIIWTDRYFLQQLGQSAPDLWGWITYVFEFSTPEKELDQEPLPYREPLPKRSKIQERQERIDELEAKLERIPVDDQSERNIRDRVSLLRLLGEEYYEQFAFDEAVQRLKIALGLTEKLDDSYGQANLHFLLGDCFLVRRQFRDAEQHYVHSRSIFMEMNDASNIGRCYHQIGRVYEDQLKWNEALAHYRQAIDWNQKTGNEFELGNTYHHIGRVYEEQAHLTKAMDQYRIAEKYARQFDQEYELSVIRESILRVRQKQADKVD